MTRRTSAPRVGESGRRANRMAPGGRLLSESPIDTFNPPLGPMSDGTLLLTVEALGEEEEVASEVEMAPGPYATLTPPQPEQH